MRKISEKCGINPGNMNKREICIKLALQFNELKLKTYTHPSSNNETNLSGEDLNTIHPSCLIRDDKYYYLDIREILDSNLNLKINENPYTKRPFSSRFIKKIRQKYEKSEKLISILNIHDLQPIIDFNTRLRNEVRDKLILAGVICIHDIIYYDRIKVTLLKIYFNEKVFVHKYSNLKFTENEIQKMDHSINKLDYLNILLDILFQKMDNTIVGYYLNNYHNNISDSDEDSDENTNEDSDESLSEYEIDF